MVTFAEISDEIRSKRLFIFDFDETVVNLNVDWEQLKQALSKMVEDRFGITITFTPILEKLQYLKSQIHQEEFLPILEYLKLGELKALEQLSTLHLVGFTLLQEIHNKLIHNSQEERYIALLSNNYTDTIIAGAKQYGFDKYITSYVGRDLVSKIKPDPEGIMKIHKRFPTISKSQIVYFGDSPIYDKLLAQNYGIDFFLISHPDER